MPNGSRAKNYKMAAGERTMQIARGKKLPMGKKLKELIVFHRRRQLLSEVGVFAWIPAAALVFAQPPSLGRVRRQHSAKTERGPP